MFGKSSLAEYSKEPEIMVGLDLGTSKISVIIVEKEDGYNEPHIIAVDAAPSCGIRKGCIINAELASKAIKQVIDTASNMVGQPLKKAVVSFSCGEDMSCITTSGRFTLGVNQRPVTEEDIERVIHQAKKDLAIPSNKTVVHTIPVRYTLDGNDIENPLTMTGRVLAVDLESVIVSSNVIQNVTNCVQRAGVEVEGLVLKPFASSLSVIGREEAQNGAAVLDIGGGTTGITVYSKGHPVYMGMIPIGGDHITNDLATILKIPLLNAEELKRKVALGNGAGEEETVQFVCNGRTCCLSYSQVEEVIVCRIEELCEDFIIPKLRESRVEALAGGIILTGGVSKTVGLDMLMRDLFNLPVRIAVPSAASAMPQGKNGQEFANVAGIVKYMTDYIGCLGNSEGQTSDEAAGKHSKDDRFTTGMKKRMPWNGSEDSVKKELKHETRKIGSKFKDLFNDLF